ncbi:2-deoxyribose-5-phosphate aldolase [Halegenticoccus soli]|uniref:2-deoxyribose-5-phosphate aldolase n=1 Tax=Halegenticoccus soli TaxID=1985678 RepID=UPI000C6EE51D|nr:deoxyribose-phosphate aldolase [Halegenticoccus soli]
MDRREFVARIDHTVLGPETTPADVERVLDEAAAYGMNACVPPCYVAEAAAHAPDVTLATVVGFPHGQHSTAAKRAEAVDAWENGADELDVVINVGRLKAGENGRNGTGGEDGEDRGGDDTHADPDRADGVAPRVDAVEADLAEVVAAVPIPVKVIIETALLSVDEKHRACRAAAEAGAAFVKTSTGFAEGGATVEDVELMREYLPVKASGGIGSYEEARAMLDAGAERIGASSGVEIVEGFPGE